MKKAVGTSYSIRNAQIDPFTGPQLTRFATLNAISERLQCKPGDLLEYTLVDSAETRAEFEKNWQMMLGKLKGAAEGAAG